jgi:hypothetical protein
VKRNQLKSEPLNCGTLHFSEWIILALVRQTPRGAPMIMRSTSAVRDFIAYSALQAFGERLTVLPTAAMPTPAAMPPATAAPPNLLDLSSVSAISEDSGRRLLCDDA